MLNKNEEDKHSKDENNKNMLKILKIERCSRRWWSVSNYEDSTLESTLNSNMEGVDVGMSLEAEQTLIGLNWASGHFKG